MLYDNDTNKPEENIENLWVRKMSINGENETFAIGVENLLTLNQNIDVPSFYKEKTKRDDYGAESTFRELDKTKLCSYICNNLTQDEQKVVLQKLENEIDKLI